MKVIVAGAGTLGRRVARYVGEKHNVVIVEQSQSGIEGRPGSG